jgi:hypothetical protein
MNKLRYVLDRLKEPGSVRSLVLALFIFKGQVPVDSAVDQATGAILLLVAIISFLMPGDAPRASGENAAPAAPVIPPIPVIPADVTSVLGTAAPLAEAGKTAAHVMTSILPSLSSLKGRL